MSGALIEKKKGIEENLGVFSGGNENIIQKARSVGLVGGKVFVGKAREITRGQT